MNRPPRTRRLQSRSMTLLTFVSASTVVRSSIKFSFGLPALEYDRYARRMERPNPTPSPGELGKQASDVRDELQL